MSSDDGDGAGVAGSSIVHNRSFSDPRGSLSAWDDVVPFSMTRVNFVYDVPENSVRGLHAHTLIHELCVCPVGGLTVTVEDASGKKDMTISGPNEAAHICPGTWITLHSFQPGTVMLIMCSGVFDPKEIIRKRDAFDEVYGVAGAPKPVDFIPVNTPIFLGDERKFLLDCIDTGWISSEGSYVKRFEEDMAAYVGRKHAVAVANGTAAIDIAVDALGIGPGDEVIMPTFTIISCVVQIARSGATPVVVDADASMNMDVSKIEGLITPKTKAILVVHLYHFAADMVPILELAKKHNLYVIEDAAEMIGQTYNGKKCGSFGTISTMSFYPNKHVTTGEGGMVLTDDPQLFERIAARRNLCFGPRAASSTPSSAGTTASPICRRPLAARSWPTSTSPSLASARSAGCTRGCSRASRGSTSLQTLSATSATSTGCTVSCSTSPSALRPRSSRRSSAIKRSGRGRSSGACMSSLSSLRWDTVRT